MIMREEEMNKKKNLTKFNFQVSYIKLYLINNNSQTT